MASTPASEPAPERPMSGRTVLVTGATSGIGRATAVGLAAMGAHLAITGRDPGRTEQAAREISAAGGSPVDAFVADMSVQAEVRRLADEVLQRLPRIDVLVNNVGGYWDTRHVTADGLERTFALNHLAPFLLTNLLLGRLEQSAPARVVTVSSGAQAMGRIDFADLQGERSYSGGRAYNQSKLANVLFTYELARRVPMASITANALHPGVVSTSFGAEDPAPFQRLLLPVIRPFLKTPARGAATSIHVASSPELAEVTGQYFVNSRPKKSSAASYDEAVAARLWQVSADLVSLDVPRPAPVPDVISPATTDADYDAFGTLIREYWEWLHERYADDPGLIQAVGSHQGLADELTALSTTYGPPAGWTLLARRGGEVTGAVAYRDMGDGGCEMKRLFVPDRHQGAGLGRRLCEALLSLATADGYRVMRLDTGKRNTEAIAMYESIGFRTVPPFHDYPADLMAYLIFMERPLTDHSTPTP